MPKNRIILLGDSIIDNGAYVRPGEPDVTKQLRALLPEHAVTKRALDGAVRADVLRSQVANLESTDRIILSAGGNDALSSRIASAAISSQAIYRPSKAEYGHAQRAQHAFLITLGTPRSGTNIANIAGVLRDVLLIKNDLLDSLKDNNTYLRMLRLLGEKTDGKSIRFGCRPVPLYVGYELEGVVGPITVVSERDAVGEATARVARDVKGFQVNHFEIAKPAGLNDLIHLFVQDSIEDAMVAGWPAGVDKLCSDARFVDERSGPDLNSYPAKNYIRPERLSN